MRLDLVTFSTQMGRLSAVFGEKAFSGDRQDNIFNAVKDLPANWFISFVNKILNTCRQAPLPFDFIDGARIEKERTGLVERAPKGSCGKCDDGIVSAVRIDTNESPYVFKCDCETGQKIREHFPQWNRAMKNFIPMNEKYFDEVRTIGPMDKRFEHLLQLSMPKGIE